MTPLPGVSVALATYNGERFLGEQLESLTRQTLLPNELVVGDDGSSDGTVALVEDFAQHAPFEVRLVQSQHHLGYVRNFLHTAALCQSVYVAFCDQDDVWLPHKLERCVTALAAAGGPSLVAHAAEAVDADLRPLGFRDPSIAHDVRYPPGCGLPGRKWLGFALCFERRLLDLVADSYSPPTVGAVTHWGHEDWVCFLAGSRYGTELLAEPLVLYRQHGRNAFGADKSAGPETLILTAANTADDFRHRAQIADLWADVIRRARDDNALSPLAVHADSWERVHRRVRDSLMIRAHMYEPTTRHDLRWRGQAMLLARGSYRALWRGGLGPRALVKDVLVCLLGPRRALRSLNLGVRAVLFTRHLAARRFRPSAGAAGRAR